MDFAVLAPEINSARMYSGPGSGPMLAAAAAWDGLAAESHWAAAAYGSVISELTTGPWLGPVSASVVAATGPYLAWMSTAAAQAEQAAIQAKAAAAAYEAAFAATVPPALIAANRALLVTLLATNVFGQNTPAIATVETDYAEMWAQDAAAMYGYAGASAAASEVTPFAPPPTSINPGGLAGQAAAAAQAAGTSAGSAQTTLSQLISAVPTALQGLTSPAASTSGLSTIVSELAGVPSPLSLLQALEGALVPLVVLGGDIAIPPAASLGLASGILVDAATPASLGAAATLAAAAPPATLASEATPLASALGTGAGSGALGAADFGNGSVLAGWGKAASIGGLSAPPGWTVAAPAVRLAGVALPAISLGAAPEVFTDSPASLFGEMALASTVGRAIGGTAHPGDRERIGATTRSRPTPSPKSPGNLTTGVAAEMRELTEVLGNLGALRDSGILTNEEFNEQKQRLLGR